MTPQQVQEIIHRLAEAPADHPPLATYSRGEWVRQGCEPPDYRPVEYMAILKDGPDGCYYGPLLCIRLQLVRQPDHLTARAVFRWKQRDRHMRFDHKLDDDVCRWFRVHHPITHNRLMEGQLI